MQRTSFSISLFSIALLISLNGSAPDIAAADERPNCDMDKGPCSGKTGDGEITLDITPKPVKAMEALIFTVVLKDIGNQKKLLLDLGMPGMYMGRNRIILKKNGAGKYTGKGVIPRCPSGRRLWRATVDIPATGKVDFFFYVSY